MIKGSPVQLAHDLESSFAELWETVALLEEEEIEGARLRDGWTPKAVVAHVAFWDDFQTRRMLAAYRGESAEHGFRRPDQDNDQRVLVDTSRAWLDVTEDAQAARQRLVDFARSLPPEALQQEYLEEGKPFSLQKLLQHMVNHVLQHRHDLRHYCGSMERWQREKLRHFCVQQNENLMQGISGLTEAAILSSQVCGVWSMRDVLAHILSWHEYCVVLVQNWPEPAAAKIDRWRRLPGEGMERYNGRLLAAEAELNMIDIADGLMTCHRRLLHSFDRFPHDGLDSKGMTWDGTGVLSCFYYEIFLHVAEHAAQIWTYRAGEASR
jgi:uncharacterized damage-inducible protein DinB